MFEDLINRALTCARSTAAPGTELPPMPVIDTASVAHYLERVVSTIPAACAPAGEPAPAQRPASLLEALGVHRILDALTDNPAACALPATGTTPQDRSTPSLLSVIGVTGLLDSLFDRD
ncbi:hypothetical protein AB0I81_16255 [Nonomuraea sp. NPDC050404]|uniref:hypothetical protein n=1 Tax=Nonomuraea sp. NPDC050404 TaxID=3155783 RepID=UPI0033FBF1EE